MLPRVYEAKDIYEAIELAESLRGEGKYDCFRGQSDSRWKMQSSFGRLDNAGRENAMLRIDKFYDWISKSREVLPFINSDDQILAIAQHYGLPTPLIDFSSEPRIAAFFAADRSHDAPKGCLFMVNQADFDQVTGFPNEDGVRYLRFLRIDVEHLWRLQAQRGFFLEERFHVEAMYPPDRIIFMHTTKNLPIERNLIYPSQKSHLERCLDDFFLKEKIDEGVEEFLKKNSHIKQISVPTPTIDIDEEEKNLFDWPYDKNWQTLPDERWEERIATDHFSAPNCDEEILTIDILSEIVKSRRPEQRLLILSETAPNFANRKQKLIDQTWANMRLLPYSDTQIADAILFSLAIDDALKGVNRTDWSQVLKAVSSLIPNPIEIEMGIESGTSTRALVKPESLIAAVRNEVIEAAKVVVGDDSIRQSDWVLAKRFSIPRSTFDRDALVNLFATEIIPWQVAIRRPFVAFSPYYIKALGRP